MKHKKLGPILLSGLMIGPILGSGIIILPPLVYQTAGNWSFPAWCLIMFLGFFFAQAFGKLTILFPGETGVSQAAEHAFGRRIKLITSLYLIGATLFGPAAVILTAAQYLPFDMDPALMAIPLMCVSSLLLLKEVSFIGKISFLLSSFAAISLFLGGALTLVGVPATEYFVLDEFSSSEIGYSLLLLFWTLVGWEVVGNYSGEVENPKRNIMRAVYISFFIIAVIGLTVAAAIQVVQNEEQITPILIPLYGTFNKPIMITLTLSLCITTYLMFVGGVSRLMGALSREQMLPEFLSKKNRSGAPLGPVLFYICFYTLMFFAVYKGIFDVAKLVALADGFFLANALIGLFTAIKLLPGIFSKTIITLLSIIFMGILLHSSLWVLCAIALIPLWVMKKVPTTAKPL